MKVLVHVPVLEGIVSGFLGGVDRGIEVLELRREAHADFERIGHSLKRRSFVYELRRSWCDGFDFVVLNAG